MASREVKIFCPKCEWEPKQSSQWMCSCLHCWNTFDTGGVCPKCGKAWPDTQCLACGRWSPHSDWYHEFVSDEVSSREEEVLPAHGVRINQEHVGYPFTNEDPHRHLELGRP